MKKHFDKFQHCQLFIAVGEICLFGSGGRTAPRSGPSPGLHGIRPLAVGRQYYTGCERAEDAAGHPCCKCWKCDALFEKATEVQLEADFENQEDPLAIKVFCKQNEK